MYCPLPHIRFHLASLALYASLVTIIALLRKIFFIVGNEYIFFKEILIEYLKQSGKEC